jgi:hypothetical protein
MDEAERCHRLAFIANGHLLAYGPLEEFSRQGSLESVFIDLIDRHAAPETA